jgi:ubiquitin fusion degradation protein 1
MLQSLGLDPDELVCVKSVNLPRASFVKFQPQSVDFLDISNPKAVLEIILRKYAALTIGDIIVLRYNDREYYLRVLEARPINPHNAVSIIETDMQVDFAPPVGYEEVKKPSPEVESNASNKGQVKIDKAKLHEDEYVDSDSESEEDKKRWKPFSGVGMRISGKAVNDHSKSAEALSKSLKSSEASGPQMPQRTPASKKFVPFSGPGYTLREPRTI